jgi:hypothetical protein
MIAGNARNKQLDNGLAEAAHVVFLFRSCSYGKWPGSQPDESGAAHALSG